MLERKTLLALIALSLAIHHQACAQQYPATATPSSPWVGYALGQTSAAAQIAEASPYAAPFYAATPYPPTKPTITSSTAIPTLDPNILLAQAPGIGYGGDPLVVDPDNQKQVDSLLPPGTRKGVFQKVKTRATYMPQLENDSIGITDLQASIVFGLPFFTRETPIVIEPRYRIQLLEGPNMPNLPARLHDVDIQFRHFRRLNSQWIFDGAVTVGLYADDHSFDDSDAFRVSGRALVVYEATEYWKWILGVVYANRAGTTVFPAVGLAYDSPTVKYQFVFPRPRAAWLLPGSIVDHDEHWVYVMGEFGGGAWSITNPIAGTPDELNMSDIRILFGYENKVPGSFSWNIEAGYVFAREIEFASAIPDASLDDTFLIRAGMSY